MSSLVLAPVDAASVFPVWRRSWKRRPVIPTVAEGTMPCRVQRRCSERAARLAGKDEMLRPGHSPGGEVGLQVGHEHRRDRDRAHTRVGLRWTEHERAVAELLVLLDHQHRPVWHVQVDLSKGAQLSDAQGAEGGEQHHRPVARLGKGDLAGLGSIHVATLEVGAGGGEPAVGEALGAERLRRCSARRPGLGSAPASARTPACGRSPTVDGPRNEAGPNDVARMWHAGPLAGRSTPSGSSERMPSSWAFDRSG